MSSQGSRISDEKQRWKTGHEFYACICLLANSYNQNFDDSNAHTISEKGLVDVSSPYGSSP